MVSGREEDLDGHAVCSCTSLASSTSSPGPDTGYGQGGTEAMPTIIIFITRMVGMWTDVGHHHVVQDNAPQPQKIFHKY